LDDLDLEAVITADVERYQRLLDKYRAGKAMTGELVKGAIVDTTKETERHLENVIRELKALLRDRAEPSK
jgi:hypothetical protein